MNDGFDLPKLEEKTLKFWRDRDIFKRSVEARKNAKRFIFFEGPPTANARPGIHHFLGRIIKDVFVRYKTMRGYFVPRRAGWDAHGLPVEIEVEKELGLKNKKDIEKFGIAKFNKKARESVWKYKEEWEKLTERIGFWLDLKNPYITYEWRYIETLWWIIKQIDKRDLLYQGHKVLPWCPRCGTALSSHEVAQGYENITETSVYLKFKLKPGQKIGDFTTDDKTFILAWTTTPWTLPGNVALAIGTGIDYVFLKRGEERYILAHSCLEHIFPKEKTDSLQKQNSFRTKQVDYNIVRQFKGKDLVGLEYKPLFNVPALRSDKSYKIYDADFVSTDEGTGVVHTAVMYGEDDYNLGTKVGLPKVHTVDETGKFLGVSKELDGRDVKSAETEKKILEYLKENNNLLTSAPYEHDYPFCWRCHSPLLYYAKKSWFVAMSKLRKELIKNNKKINWVPEHLKEGRFGEFIKEVKDWAFSRERYWGTPLPIWQCENCQSNKIIGSLEELEESRFRPKNRFFLLRHGKRAQSHDKYGHELTSCKLDKDKYDLTPEGAGQIETLAEKIKKEGGVDLIYSSPFLRTRKTAEIIAKSLGLKVHVDERLKEIDRGSACEGKTQAAFFAFLSPGAKPDYDTKYSDGESWREVKKRMFSIVDKIDQDNENKKILLVGHGDPLFVLFGTAENMTEEETAEEMLTRKRGLYFEKGELKEIGWKNHPRNDFGDLDLHRPFVDQVVLKCGKCGGKMIRIKEVADVWFDSGAMPFAQCHFPFENKNDFEKGFPADFIAEGIDQTRGWFYTLLAVATLLEKKAPYKNVISYSHVLDAKGRKMSKSLGNSVDPWKVIEEAGTDATRWYFYTVNSPGDPKLFAIGEVKKRGVFLSNLLNSLRFFELYAHSGRKQPRGDAVNILDKWILSRLVKTVLLAGKSLEDYDPSSAARTIEEFAINDFSNWWLRRSRERFQRPKNTDDLERSLRFLRFLLTELSKLTAPFVPFASENIYKKVAGRKESVHLEDWPSVKRKSIDEQLEKRMDLIRKITTLGLAARKKTGIRVRQPLPFVSINPNLLATDMNDEERRVLLPLNEELEELIMAELNVKKVVYDTSQEEAVFLEQKLTPELVTEGLAKEIMRQLQEMRKQAGYRLDEKIFASWKSDNQALISAIEKFHQEIAAVALIKEMRRGCHSKEAFDVEKELDLAPQATIWLGVRGGKK